MRISFVFAQVIGSDDYVLGAATAKLIYRRAKRSYTRFLCRSLREKLLNLFEPDIHVIVRGKAGAEVALATC